MPTKFNYTLIGIMMFMINSLNYAEAKYAKEADNWCTQAEKSLTTNDGNSITCMSVNKRCVKMNNYWCQKHSTSPWKGTPNHEGKDGNRDAAGHAIFQSAEWSARAIAVDMRSKYMRGLTTAVQIAERHSPWCDTLGSVAVSRNGSGRTCKDGQAAPPLGFSGPLCKAPITQSPTKSDCIPGCNCPPEIATTLVNGLTIGINDDLNLFDKTGTPQPNLNIILKNLAIQEQGIYVRPIVIERGISKLSN